MSVTEGESPFSLPLPLEQLGRISTNGSMVNAASTCSWKIGQCLRSWSWMVLLRDWGGKNKGCKCFVMQREKCCLGYNWLVLQGTLNALNQH
ncbi:hypothetical protein Q5P01_006658 [Channa striata]|uniref:Uncharacterized protein n=1 Tax=Channa striata TaxID=64152 RepID=A0AA88SX59_CHASR|nr:hypothetical protein Q5P01_006658 [Channa striata]